MKLILKRMSDSTEHGSYVQGMRDNRLFKLTNEIDKAMKFDDVPSIIGFIAQHDHHIGPYDIVRVEHAGWREVGSVFCD